MPLANLLPAAAWGMSRCHSLVAQASRQPAWLLTGRRLARAREQVPKLSREAPHPMLCFDQPHCASMPFLLHRYVLESRTSPLPRFSQVQGCYD